MLENVNFLKPHVFRERNKKYGYYDYKKNTLYYLNADNRMQYQVLSLRYMTGLILGFAVYILFHHFFSALVVAAAVSVVMELIFRLKFLPSCRTKTDVRLETLKPCMANGEDGIQPKKQKKQGILLIALGVLLVMNAYDLNLQDMELILSWAGGGICILSGGVQFLKGVLVH